MDEGALEVDKSWTIGCVDGCCSKPQVGGVRRKKDKRGRRWSTLNLSAAFKEGVAVHNMFEAIKEEIEEEEAVEVPPGLTDDSEPEVEKEKLADPDSEEEEQEMEEWLVKLGVKKVTGDEEVIVKRESKEAGGKKEKKGGDVKYSEYLTRRPGRGEARRGMEKEVGVEEEIFIGDVTSEKRRKMKINFKWRT